VAVDVGAVVLAADVGAAVLVAVRAAHPWHERPSPGLLRRGRFLDRPCPGRSNSLPAYRQCSRFPHTSSTHDTARARSTSRHTPRHSLRCHHSVVLHTSRTCRGRRGTTRSTRCTPPGAQGIAPPAGALPEQLLAPPAGTAIRNRGCSCCAAAWRRRAAAMSRSLWTTAGGGGLMRARGCRRRMLRPSCWR
jgi:hypothetical protein